MIDRRKLLAGGIGGLSVGLIGGARAELGKSGPYDFSDIQTRTELAEAFDDFESIRFKRLETESLMDFTGGFKRWQKEYGHYGDPVVMARRNEFIASLGYSTGPTDLPFEECHQILMEDPIYRSEIRIARAIQELMWNRARAALYQNFDYYIGAMEATDKEGPGSLELNPRMTVPEYARYEIHQQPGGYVGDPLSGVLYHYATTTAFNQGIINGPVRHDQQFIELARQVPMPPDGKVKRILDLGCGAGRLAIELKNRFPGAEVWGLDVGGPMVRHAHNRAVTLGVDVNWVQRLAEETGFDDGYFDIVTANLLFHEVPAFVSRKIVPEIHRVLRKGGVWTGDSANGYAPFPRGIVSKAATWVNHRYNVEPWEIQWYNLDFGALGREAGLQLVSSGINGYSIKT